MLKSSLGRTLIQQYCNCLERSLLPAATVNSQQSRNTVIVRRKFPVMLAKEGEFPKLKRKNFVYELVDNIAHHKKPNIDVILTDYVEGLGDRGDVVSVRRRMARNRLFPAGLAVYCSPENITEFENEKEALGEQDQKPKMTAHAKSTARQLAGMNLPVPMNPSGDWELTKQHVRVAFRRVGVEVPDSCITMPGEAINSPQDFSVSVTINGLETVKVQAYTYYWYENVDRDAPEQRHPRRPIWAKSKVELDY